MEYTEITLHSYSVNEGTVQVGYRIDATCTLPGELPTIFIFAYAIRDVNDVTADAFSHVATVHEIQDVIIDRDTAIAAGQDTYFLSFAQFTYDDLITAVEARAQLKTRLNDLTRGWISYRDDFLTTEENNLFPSSDPAVEEETVDAYVDARTARQEAEVAVNQAEEAVSATASDVVNAQEFIDVYLPQEAYLVEYRAHLDEYFSRVTNEGSSAVDYRVNTIYPSLTAETLSVRGKLQTWSNTKVSRQQVYEEALQTKIAADQELAAAQAAEDEALAAALAANPDFDPETV